MPPEAHDDAHDLFGEAIELRDKDLDEGLEVLLLVGREADLENLELAFDDTLCESTSCGVAVGQFKTEDGGCESTYAPTPGTDAALRGGRVAVALVVGGVMTLLA